VRRICAQSAHALHLGADAAEHFIEHLGESIELVAAAAAR
jgi:hypothetical protein